MSYHTVKNAMDKLEQRIHGSQKEQQQFTVSFEDDTSTDLPGEIVHVFGGGNPGVYRVDDQGNRHLLRKGQT